MLLYFSRRGRNTYAGVPTMDAKMSSLASNLAIPKSQIRSTGWSESVDSSSMFSGFKSLMNSARQSILLAGHLPMNDAVRMQSRHSL